MSKTKTYRVKENRIRYICDNCKTKRSLPVPPQARSRSVRCHNCGTMARCNLNRRNFPRSQQTGKVTMMLSSGREFEIDLQDISTGGVGADMKPGGSRSVSLRDEVQFKCSWNPRLFANGRYVITSISGTRVGIQNIAYKGW